jgi:hypothetical protein
MTVNSLFPLDFRGVPFKRKPMRVYSSGGTSYFRWVPVGMPQLGKYKWILDMVFFLYPTEGDALAGTKYGGTGVLVAVPFSRWPDEYFHVHGVTNWHVAVRDGASVVRVNRRTEDIPDTFAFDPHEWVFRPNYHDVAISPPLRLDREIHKAEAASLNSLVREEDEIKEDLNAAEDVFMIGRCVDYVGAETNIPACRFGNISIMNAAIRQPNGFSDRSIVVDMHSRTGFSDSPVFVYRNPGSTFAPMLDLVLSWHYMKLIGIHWGQFPENWPLKDKLVSPLAASQASLVTDGKYVEGLSGMSCVVPAAAIIDLLNSPELVAMRESDEANLEPVMVQRGLRPQATGSRKLNHVTRQISQP